MSMLLLNTKNAITSLQSNIFLKDKEGFGPLLVNILDKGVYRKVESRIAKQKWATIFDHESKADLLWNAYKERLGCSKYNCNHFDLDSGHSLNVFK